VQGLKRSFTFTIAVFFLALFCFNSAAKATTPTPPVNPFTKKAGNKSWIDVPESDKIYLVDPGSNSEGLFNYIPSGSCTINGVPYLGPLITFRSACGTAGLPIGFEIDFFGDTSYTSLWANEDGQIYFVRPSSTDYDVTLPRLATTANTSVISVGGGDQQFATGKSNFWMAQTTVNSRQAFVISWEEFQSYNTSGEHLSYQFVLINLGNGDFDAWFNYDNFQKDTEQSTIRSGYIGPRFIVDATSEINTTLDTFTTTSYVASVSDYPHQCQAGFYQVAGTDPVLPIKTNPALSPGNSLSGTYYLRFLDRSTSTFAIFETEADCTSDQYRYNFLPESKPKAYFIFGPDSDPGKTFQSLAVGWSIYRTSNHEILTTDLLSNIPIAKLQNDGSDQIISKSINTTTPGRFIIGQRSGVTTMNVESDTPSNSSGGGSSSTTSQVVTKIVSCLGVKETIKFNGGSSEIGRTAKKKLKDLSAQIKTCNYKNIKLTGYTSIDQKDSPGYKIFRKNLSLNRAHNVQTELKKNLGTNFKNVKYKISGLSEKNPIESNKYEKTRKANRRVEIVITK
jgi:outer membrane protein OmpA-like peptidoglycan-associated protein